MPTDRRHRHRRRRTTGTEVPLQDVVSLLLSEQDKRNDLRFKAADQAAKVAFEAAEKAIMKSEDSQQAAIDAKFDANERATAKAEFNACSRLDSITNSLSSWLERLSKQIAELRESRSEIGGAKLGLRDLFGYFVGAGGLMVAVVAVFMKHI